jgi:hypothetical protein
VPFVALRVAAVGALVLATTSCTYIENYHESPYLFRTTEADRQAVTMDPLDAVVRIAGIGGICSGTLVTSRVVLTSRACYRRIAFSDLGATPRLRAGAGGGPIPHDSVDVVAVVDPACSDMVALVLADDLLAPPVRLRLGATIALGEPVRVIGFGGCTGQIGTGRFVGYAGRVESADSTTMNVSAPSCFDDSGGPVVSQWTGEIVGVLLRGGTVGRIDVAENLLTRAFLLSHGARFLGPETCQ